MSSMCSPAARWWGRSISTALGALRRISWSLRASLLTILLNASWWDRRRSIRYGVLERKAVGVDQHPCRTSENSQRPVGLLSCRPPKATRKKSAPEPTALYAPTQAHRRRSDELCGTSPPDAAGHPLL